MGHENLKSRTHAYALQVIRVVEHLPRTLTAGVIARQLVRSATSVGANYRAACRARSRADFIAKMKIVEEEADESIYWLQLLVDSGSVSPADVNDLLLEADEILAVVVSSIRTALRNREK